MKTVTLFCLLATLLGACAHRNFEDDKHDANYHQGLYSAPINDPASLTQGNSPLPLNYLGQSGEVAALAVAGAYLAANPDYYRKFAVSGHCFTRTAATDTIELPCTHVDVILQDTHGKDLSRVQVDGGEFAFRVAPKTPYRIRVESKRWKMDPPETRELFLGDDVLLHLVRK